MVAALSLTRKGHPLYLKLSHLSGFTRDEIAAWSARFIKPGSHVVSDGLSCFLAVTDSQCRHEPIITYKDGLDEGKRREENAAIIYVGQWESSAWIYLAGAAVVGILLLSARLVLERIRRSRRRFRIVKS